MILPKEAQLHLPQEKEQHEPSSVAPIAGTHANPSEYSLLATASQWVFLAACIEHQTQKMDGWLILENKLIP